MDAVSLGLHLSFDFTCALEAMLHASGIDKIGPHLALLVLITYWDLSYELISRHFNWYPQFTPKYNVPVFFGIFETIPDSSLSFQIFQLYLSLSK